MRVAPACFSWFPSAKQRLHHQGYVLARPGIARRSGRSCRPSRAGAGAGTARLSSGCGPMFLRLGPDRKKRARRNVRRIIAIVGSRDLIEYDDRVLAYLPFHSISHSGFCWKGNVSLKYIYRSTQTPLFFHCRRVTACLNTLSVGLSSEHELAQVLVSLAIHRSLCVADTDVWFCVQ